MSDNKLRFKCPGCDKTLAVATAHIGKTVACPDCKTRTQVPDSDSIDPASTVGENPTATHELPMGEGLPSFQTANFQTASAQVPSSSRPSPQMPGVTAPGVTALSVTALSVPTPGVFSADADSFPQATAESVAAKPRTSVHWIAGLTVAGLVAIAFSILWLIITVVTGMELGILAWGLGGAIGLVAGMIGRNSSPWYCGATAAIAMASVLSAKVIMAAGLMLVGASVMMLENLAEFSPERQKQMHALADEMLTDGTVDAAQQDYAKKYVTAYFSGQPELLYEEIDDRSYEIGESLESVLADRLESMTDPEKEQLVARARTRHPEWIEDNNHYYAMIDQLTANENDLDADLVAHAEFQLAQVNQNYDQSYSEANSADELQERSAKLRVLAAQRLVELDEAARDQAIREAMTRQTNWNPFPDASAAMMEKMVRDGEFQGEAAVHAANQVAEILENDYSAYDDETPYEELQKQRAEVQRAVNASVALLDPAARQALIADAQSRYPDWYGENMSPGQRQKRVEDTLEELGTDGTFVGSLKAVFGLFDVLWLFLGASTAYGTAKKYGET
jgi:hypothetical protein